MVETISKAWINQQENRFNGATKRHGRVLDAAEAPHIMPLPTDEFRLLATIRVRLDFR